MKIRTIAKIAVLLVPLFVAGQQMQTNDPKLNEIRAKHQRGEKITEEERDYHESAIERQNQTESAKRQVEWAKAHPARESIGMIPLPDLGKGEYQGQQGGLYPKGENTSPAAHLKAGLRAASEIVPLDREGHKSPNGRIGMCSIGMSNTTQESRSLIKILSSGDQGLNSKFAFVDCSQGSMTASKIQNPQFPYWQMVAARLRDAEVSPQQVQVVWIKEANGTPKEPFPEHAKLMQNQLVNVLHILKDKFPNLKIAYLSSRIYGGWAVGALNPEPWAYEEGFGVKWLIADQIAGKPELNYDPAKGKVVSPWIAWGPYLWADGLKGRKTDDTIWKREDLGPDGTHPSMLGREKVARLLLGFLKKDPTARPWSLKQ